MIEINGIRFYSLPDAAEKTGFAINTLRSYCKVGKIEATKAANKWIIPENALLKFLQGK